MALINIKDQTQQEWRCDIGTLASDDLDTYLHLLHRGERVSNGFWVGDQGLVRGKLILRYAVLHILGIKTREDVLTRFGSAMSKQLRLEGWRTSQQLSYFAALDAAFPEYEIYPWEMQRVPQEFWSRPGAGLAALRWFLDKQGWTPAECYGQLLDQADTVYTQLSKLRLSWLCEDFRVFALLKICDPTIDARPVSMIRQDRKLQERSLPALQCPLCTGRYHRLYHHFMRSHPSYNREDIIEMMGTGDPLDSPLVIKRMSQGVRNNKAKHRRSAHLVGQGLVVPVGKWPKSQYVSLEMEEWSEALEVRPLSVGSHKWTVRASVCVYHEGSVIIYIPKKIAGSIITDTIVRYIGQDTIALRFRTDEARALVWRWYQGRARRK